MFLQVGKISLHLWPASEECGLFFEELANKNNLKKSENNT